MHRVPCQVLHMHPRGTSPPLTKVARPVVDVATKGMFKLSAAPRKGTISGKSKPAWKVQEQTPVGDPAQPLTITGIQKTSKRVVFP